MSTTTELLYTACQSGQQFTASLWDYKTANIISLYKNGGTCGRNCLGRIGNDYIISIEQQKPLLHTWCLNGKEQLQNFKMVLPETASNLAVSPNSNYLALSFGCKLGIWQLNSGNLLFFTEKHFQPITVIKFCNEGNYISTGGKDGMFITYNFGNIIDLQNNYFAQSSSNLVKPLYCKADHTASITDIHIGNFESKSRVVTVSDDKSAMVYSLINGDTLLKMLSSNILTSVITNKPFLNIFAGTNTGTIETWSLKERPRTLIDHNTEKRIENQFVGHQKKINCLALNFSCDILASGSDDYSVFLWDVASKTLLQIIEQKSAITNLIFTFSHVNMFNESYKPQFVIKAMQKVFNDTKLNNEISISQSEDIHFSDEEDPVNTTEDIALIEKYNNLKRSNKQLYNKLIELSMK